MLKTQDIKKCVMVQRDMLKY
ncbi:UNVERIFIED_CONTAM: hypothetical protein GTU68_002777 [Idotea baltica]|nr:hypothetical protein [Idotea baltica]